MSQSQPGCNDAYPAQLTNGVVQIKGVKKKPQNVTKAKKSCMTVTIQVPKGCTVPWLRRHMIHPERFGVWCSHRGAADYRDSRETKTKCQMVSKVTYSGQ